MTELTAEIVRELLRYDPQTGFLHWKWRDEKWFKAKCDYKTWNTKFAGKRAFTTTDVHGYLIGRIFGKTRKSHRIIWLIKTGQWPNQIDHINGIKNDNRWINLRSVSNAENGKNQKRHKNNKSGVSGVYWKKREGKWWARITVSGRKIDLGFYVSFDDAVAARKFAEKQYGYHANHGRPL